MRRISSRTKTLHRLYMSEALVHSAKSRCHCSNSSSSCTAQSIPTWFVHSWTRCLRRNPKQETFTSLALNPVLNCGVSFLARGAGRAERLFLPCASETLGFQGLVKRLRLRPSGSLRRRVQCGHVASHIQAYTEPWVQHRNPYANTQEVAAVVLSSHDMENVVPKPVNVGCLTVSGDPKPIRKLPKR